MVSFCFHFSTILILTNFKMLKVPHEIKLQLASAYETDHVAPVLLGLGYITQHTFFQVHPFSCEDHFSSELDRIPLCSLTTFHYPFISR